MNVVFLKGNVGHSAKITTFENGGKVAQFSLATTERGYTKKDGTKVDPTTEWHNIVVWGKNAEWAENYIRKGTRLYLEGKIRTRTWEDRNAIKRYVTEIYADTLEILGRSQS